MSSILLAAAAILTLVLGYVYYSPRVSRWMGVDLNRKMPAVEFRDGVDYVPAKHWTVLFGHHFASIAGAAPIIGPVIACLFWGWLPAVLWLVFGGIFFGAVHDYAALILSVRNKGESIATMMEDVLGRTAKIVFSMFVFLALILVVAVFAAVAGKTLATTPQVVIPTFGLVFVAFAVGFMMYNLRMNLLLCSVIGLAFMLALIIVGYKFPVSLPESFGPEKAAGVWTIILLVYGLVASVTPVTLLLQPRDHLAAGVLFAGMLLGFGGILVANPVMKAPPFVSFGSAKGALWPMLFVTVACGAISGFHSLVASGTTSKQLPRMRDARPIAYGGMIMESALSVLAVIAVCAGLYWNEVPAGLQGHVYQDVFTNGGWIKAFGTGYGQITGKLLSVFGMGALGSLIGITMLKTFVMTTLDSATRITRYICSELLGDTLNIPFMKNKYAATALVGVLAGALALGNWRAIWPVFGASNQLIASLVFIAVSAYLVMRGKNWLFAGIPAILMLVTTLGALAWQAYSFLAEEEPKCMLAIIAIVLMILAVFILFRSARVLHAAGRRRIVGHLEHPDEEEMISPHL